MGSKASSDREIAAQTAGRRVAAGLSAAEAATEAAWREAQTLTALLPAAEGQGDAADREPASTPARALGRARVHLSRAHEALADVARRIGLDETAVGPLDKPDDTPPIGGGPSRRRPAPPRPS